MTSAHVHQPAAFRYALSPQEAADALGVSRQHIYTLMGDGRLPSFHIGKSRRIKLTDVEALATQEPATPVLVSRA